MIGTVATKIGLVHAVDRISHEGSLYTACKRVYTKSQLEVGPIPTCVWCIAGKAWPSGLMAQTIHNPCAEIELGSDGFDEHSTDAVRMGEAIADGFYSTFDRLLKGRK